MKKYFLFLLAALAFVACGEDDDDVSSEQKPGPDVVVDAASFAVSDYSSAIDMSYANMVKTYGEAELSFASYYNYSSAQLKNDKVESVTFIVNPDNNKICSVNEIFAEGAYKAEDINKYFASKLRSYGFNETDSCYTYGNAEKPEESTLYVHVYGSMMVVYSNPQNQIQDIVNGSIDGTPVEVERLLLGQNINDLLDEYPDAFIAISDSLYMINYEDDPYLMSVAANVSDGIVNKVTILYNEELTDEDVIAYYTEEGYQCMPTGNVTEDGATQYMFTNVATGSIIIYADLVGVSTLLSDDPDEDFGDDEE